MSFFVFTNAVVCPDCILVARRTESIKQVFGSNCLQTKGSQLRSNTEQFTSTKSVCLYPEIIDADRNFDIRDYLRRYDIDNSFSKLSNEMGVQLGRRLVSETISGVKCFAVIIGVIDIGDGMKENSYIPFKFDAPKEEKLESEVKNNISLIDAIISKIPKLSDAGVSGLTFSLASAEVMPNELDSVLSLINRSSTKQLDFSTRIDVSNVNKKIGFIDTTEHTPLEKKDATMQNICDDVKRKRDVVDNGTLRFTTKVPAHFKNVDEKDVKNQDSGKNEGVQLKTDGNRDTKDDILESQKLKDSIMNGEIIFDKKTNKYIRSNDSISITQEKLNELNEMMKKDDEVRVKKMDNEADEAKTDKMAGLEKDEEKDGKQMNKMKEKPKVKGKKPMKAIKSDAPSEMDKRLSVMEIDNIKMTDARATATDKTGLKR